MFEYCQVRVSEVGSPPGLVQEIKTLAEAIGRDDIGGKVAICSGQVEGCAVTPLRHDLVTELLGERGNVFFKTYDDRSREELGNRRSSDAVEVMIYCAKFGLGAPVPQRVFSGCGMSWGTVNEDRYTDTAAELT